MPADGGSGSELGVVAGGGRGNFMAWLLWLLWPGSGDCKPT